ncbi:MAG: hypothetical protein P1U57_04640 [Oleibacter sp.]|nr:hypothetical protein [Thalassolituus sp.]
MKTTTKNILFRNLTAAALMTCLPVSVALAEVELKNVKMRTNGLADFQSTYAKHGMLGIGLTNTLSENSESGLGVMFTGRYFATEKWYALGEFALSESKGMDATANTSSSSNDGVTRYALGLGYSVLQGTVSIYGERAMALTLAGELAVGEQTTYGNGGRYTSGGVSLQLQAPKYWTALGVRQFMIADDNLESIGQNRGMQWDISLGFWF